MQTDIADVAKIIHLKDAGESWPTIEKMTGMSYDKVRGLYRRHHNKPEFQRRKDSANNEPSCVIDGVVAADYWPDETEVIADAICEFDKRHKLEERRQSQELRFSHGPAALIFVADVHLGAVGCNVQRAFDEAELMVSIPGSRIVFAGDGRDSFIIGRLLALQMNQEMSICKELVLFKSWLRIVAPRLAALVSGNHDEWATLLTGIPYTREVADMISPNAIYADHETTLTVKVGEASFPGMCRHDWPGTSQYNETHGIDKAFAFKWQDLRWGVGAHRHTGGVTRSSNVAGVHRIAAMCGTYKQYDEYPVRKGLGPSGNSTAIGIVFHECPPHMIGFDNLELLADYMHTMYKE